MTQKSKIGILKYIAASGAKGVKFEDEPETWYNPSTDECKGQVKDEYKGKTVEIMMVEGEKTKFSSMTLLDTPADTAPQVEEERIEENIVDLEQPEQETVEELMGQPPKEEKQSPAPPAKEEMKQPAADEKVCGGPGPMTDLASATSILGEMEMIKRLMGTTEEYTHDVYKEMESTKLETAKKGSMNLTYASWAEAWGALKRLHPTAQAHVHENNEGLPVFYNKDLPGMGAFVKVTVKVKGLEHTVHLPVMDHSNKSIAVGTMTTFDINKNIQRALAKAIALHGMGLYVFKGEDYPTDPAKK